MDAIESLRISWRSIRDHKLRSTLTTLGVVIGVAAVITFVTLGASLQADIVRAVAGQNTDLMYVSTTAGEDSQLPSVGQGGRPVFTAYDAAQIRDIEGVAAVAPVGGMAAGPVEYRNDTVGRQFVTITTGAYFDAQGYEFVAGQAFDDDSREVVFNQQAASMFGTNVSVGDNVTITKAATGQEIEATVAGIVREGDGNGESSFLPSDGQAAIYAPPDPFYDRTVLSPSAEARQHVYPRLLVVASDVREVEVVKGRVLTYLAERSDAQVLKPQGYSFEVTTYDQLVSQIEQISRTFTAYISGVAVISLVVGAIGIANIMLVSVAERTREIGIAKAVGARRRDVLEMFLVEATLLGLFGAVLGVVVGTAVGYAATVLIGLPFRFRPLWFVVAVGVGVLVGVVAGLYPAWDAARVDPIDALRHN